MSFFASKTTKEEPSAVATVMTTGGRIDEVTAALIAAAADSDTEVARSISKSILDVGKKQPDLVLSSINDFFLKNPKLPQNHRVILLNDAYNILEMRKQEIHPNLAQHLIRLAISEMCLEKEVVPDWQGAASNVLVSLASRFPNEILTELMGRYTPGQVPHYFIVKTLGDVISANSIDTVPKLKEIMARVTPILGSIKQDNIRWVFASAIGHFCDAITHYVANKDKAPDQSFNIYSFSSDMFPAYEFMFTNWLQSKETKVRLATLQALGSIGGVLTREQLEAQLPKIVPIFLGFFKKEKDTLPVTQGFNSLAWVAVKDKSRIMDPQLRSILETIHPLACIIPEYSNHSVSMKNYNELLRIYQTLGISFSENIISFLLERLNPKEAKNITLRVGTLAVIRHLITHSENRLDDIRGLIVSGVKPLLKTESSLKIKKELAHIVIAMASRDYLSLEGGDEFVDFTIRNAAISDEEIEKWNKDKSKEKDESVSPTELRNMCENILNLITTTIEGTDKFLWPYLLETLVPAQYAGALGTVCKCIAFLASSKRENETEDYIIDFDRQVNLPKPAAIIARLFVMLNAPQRRGPLGVNILATLKAIGPILHPSICDMWDNALPKLISFLEDPNKWNPTLWEELVIRLLGETIKVANDDEWTTHLGEQLEKQFDLYKDDPELKRIAFKHMGLILQKANHKEFIKSRLETMLAVADPNNDSERTGCGQAFGYCSASHLDMALEKVNSPPKPATAKKESSGGLFSFMSKDKKDSSSNVDVNNTVILCYGYIAAYALPNLITSRIEISIINNLKPMMLAAKTVSSKESIVKAIDLIGKAMHPSHLKKEFVFKQRDELLKQVITFMMPKDPKENVDNLRALGLPACATLINLEPVLPDDLEKAVLERSVTFFGVGTSDKDKQIVEGLNMLFLSVLYSQPSVETLCRLFQYIEPWICSKEAAQRERACGSVLYLLKKYLELKKGEEGERPEKAFNEVGHCIAMLIPRCTDPVVAVRQSAIEAIQMSLFIDNVLKSKPGTDHSEIPAELAAFTDIKNRIAAEELNEQFSIIHEMSRLLSKLIVPMELPELLLSSLKGLNDSQLASTSGTCVVLNGLIKTRGKELLIKVPQLVAGLLAAMEGISNEQTMNGTLHALRSLASHHEIPVVTKLLDSPVPHSKHVVKALQAIAKDENLVMPLVNHLIEIVNNGQLYDEGTDAKTKKTGLIPNLVPMSATCAIGELMELEEMEDIVNEHYYMICGSLLMRFGTCSGMVDNTASQQTVTAFKQFLDCSKDTAVLSVLEENNSKLTGAEYEKAITELSSAIAKTHPKEMKKIYDFLFPYLKGNFIGQRIVTAAVFAEFINQCKNDKQLLQALINMMLQSLADPQVKIQALRGLGNIVSVDRDEANKWAPTILDALLTSIDDQNEAIAKEAMSGLSKIFAIVEESRIAPIIINICNRIRPAFDKDNQEIRSAAFTLFGSLHRFGQGQSAESFNEQVHNYLPAVVLHIGDDSPQVQKACKGALRLLAPLFRGAEQLNTFIQTELDEKRTLDYVEFLNSLSIELIAKYPERTNAYVMTSVEYFKSQWPTIKSNASIFTGFLLGNLPIEKRRNLNPTLVARAMIALLKENHPLVRKAAAESMSMLHTY